MWIDTLTGVADSSGVVLVAHPGDDVLVSIGLARDGPDVRIAKKCRELARSARRLREAHDVVVLASTVPAEIERDLDALLRLRAARWDASFDAAAEEFVHELAASLARRDLLRLWAIDIDGATASVLFGWRLGARAFADSQACDRAHERCSTSTSCSSTATTVGPELAGTSRTSSPRAPFATRSRRADHETVIALAPYPLRRLLRGCLPEPAREAGDATARRA